MPFFSLHALSEQTLDFITAVVTYEGKKLGCNRTASEDTGVSCVRGAVRNGAVSGEDWTATEAVQMNVSFTL